jgi:hypothetical protein
MRYMQNMIFVTLTFTMPTLPTMADEEVELVEVMSAMEHFSHKLNLSVEHRNTTLASFYAHELEEIIEQAEEVESYDDYPVGAMVKSMLVPAFEKFEDALDEGDWNTISERFDSVVEACNACHTATAHGYIRVQRNAFNPFMQSFEAAE